MEFFKAATIQIEIQRPITSRAYQRDEDIQMDVSAIATAAKAFSATQVGDAPQAPIMKKAQEAEGKGALALLDALPKPANLPSHLGQNINTTA